MKLLKKEFSTSSRNALIDPDRFAPPRVHPRSDTPASLATPEESSVVTKAPATGERDVREPDSDAAIAGSNKKTGSKLEISIHFRLVEGAGLPIAFLKYSKTSPTGGGTKIRKTLEFAETLAAVKDALSGDDIENVWSSFLKHAETPSVS